MELQLVQAAEDGDINKVRQLIADGVNPAAMYNSAIRLASEYGYFEVVRLLLQDPRVDPAALDNYAIQWASAKGHLAVVRLLLQDPRVNPAANNNEAIQGASHYGHLELVRLLLSDPRVDPTALDNYAIRWASENGHLEVVRLLLQDPRVNPAADDNSAIQLASVNGHLAVVRLLLSDPRVDPAAYDNYAIRQASENGHLAVVQLLAIAQGFESQGTNQELFYWSISKELSEVVKSLAKLNDVEPAADENQALLLAAGTGNLEMIKWLIQQPKVDLVSVRDLVIAYAQKNGHIETVTFFQNYK